MLFYVDPHSGVPIFRQLMDQVKRNVATGVLESGDEMPSIRHLSVPLGVNPMTISKAYNLLVHEGVLERRPGRPLVVAAVDGAAAKRRQEEQLRDILKPAVVLANQLGLSPAQATRLYRELFDTVDDDWRDSGDQGESQ